MSNTREEWLVKATKLLRPVFDKRTDGWTVPDNVRTSCGFPRGARKAIGQCWSSDNSADDTLEVFISPVVDDSIDVLQILVHELVHAAVGLKAGHREPFGTVARAMALEGKLTATVAGDTFKREIAAPLLAKLGDYPHAALTVGGINTGPKKQGTRMLKAFCPKCDYTVRTTAKWLDIATPTCPDESCKGYGKDMKVE